MSVVVVALLLLACLGWGGLTLTALRILPTIDRPGLRLALAFAVGHGVLGWLMFPLGVAGLLSPAVLVALLLLPLPGLWPLVRRWLPTEPLTRLELALLAVLAASLASSIVQGLAPPSDADSLAYHFALPKLFLETGAITFVPRAVDGAVPLLVQMTYLIALGLGGETAMTLWSALSSWGTPALMAALALPHLGRAWTLAATLALVTMPAYVYGASGGQIETKVAMDVLVAAWAVARAVTGGGIRFAVLGGIGAGLFMASKYTGLLLVAAAGLPLLIAPARSLPAWLGRGLVYGLSAMLTGGQWYGWNWMHTGDPIFPLMFQTLGLPDGPYWNLRHDQVFHQGFYGAELERPRTLWWALLYPFEVTLAPAARYEAGRTGLGPLFLLLLPFALTGAWCRRERLRTSPLLVHAAIALAFYLLFFLTGSSQRVRHLLPIVPLAVPVMLTAALAAGTLGSGLIRPLAAALLATITLQGAGAALFAKNFVQHLATGESRTAFLARTVPFAEPVEWINATLTRADTLYFDLRQLAYLIEVPSVMGHSVDFALVESDPGSIDPTTFVRQLRRLGITHVLAAGFDRHNLAVANPEDPQSMRMAPLVVMGCLTQMAELQGRQIPSRTLSAPSPPLPVSVLQLDPAVCPH